MCIKLITQIRKSSFRHTSLATLECNIVPEISDALPSLRQLQAIFPKQCCNPLEDLLNHYRGRPGVAEPIAPPIHSDMDVEPAAIRGPWHGRLRSSSGSNLVSRADSRLEHPMHKEPAPSTIATTSMGPKPVAAKSQGSPKASPQGKGCSQ